MKFGKIALIALITASSYNIAYAQDVAPVFANIFGDNAILQRDKPIKIWGTSSPNAELTLKAASIEQQIKADKEGNWAATLPPVTANSNGISISIAQGEKQSTISNILIGDVFLCSGQSNMEFTAKYETNAEQNMLNSSDSLLRFFNVPKQTADYEQKEFKAKSQWELAGPKTVGNTSAVCYSMVQSLRKSQKIPMGFVNSTWGGTKIETWVSEDTLAKRDRYKAQLEQSNALKKNNSIATLDWGNNNLKFWEQNEPDNSTKKTWRDVNFNDSDWGNINIGEFWEAADIKALEQFDGLVWYRVSVNLTAEQAKSAISINLGPIDDQDNFFINGKFIGATDGWDTKRKYNIPANTLKVGKNTIAVRIYDGGGGGGLWGDIGLNYIELKDGAKIQLPTNWKYKISAGVKDIPPPPPSGFSLATRPSTIYNAMINPMKGISFKGVAWYQGESNVGLDREYADITALWMENWRDIFGDKKMPFAIVQLSAFGPTTDKPVNSAWAALRNSQLEAIKADSNSAMATSIDIGDRYDIHPTQKQILGVRLAKAISAVAYNTDSSRIGPYPVSATINNGSVVVKFNDLGGSLKSYSTQNPPSVELCQGAKCEYALANVDGESLKITIPENMTPDKVRYAWADSPFVTLFSGNDLPIPTFELEIK